MKRILFLGMVIAVVLCGCKKEKRPLAIIETDFGSITIEFYEQDAPNTVKNFITLAKKGFYDGLTFHRIVPGFVIQGGDPRGDGTGDAGYKIAAEFNSRKHVEGTVAMARGSDINSASCQFYIALKRLPHLDGKYTVFGQVISGMDVVHKIANVKTGPNDRPIEPVYIRKITIKE